MKKFTYYWEFNGIGDYSHIFSLKRAEKHQFLKRVNFVLNHPIYNDLSDYDKKNLCDFKEHLERKDFYYPFSDSWFRVLEKAEEMGRKINSMLVRQFISRSASVLQFDDDDEPDNVVPF